MSTPPDRNGRSQLVGANDAIRALLDLAPPKAVVIRGRRRPEIPAAEVRVNDLLLGRGAVVRENAVRRPLERRSPHQIRDAAID